MNERIKVPTQFVLDIGKELYCVLFQARWIPVSKVMDKLKFVIITIYYLRTSRTDTTHYKGLITRRITTPAVLDYSESFLLRSLT